MASHIVTGDGQGNRTFSAATAGAEAETMVN